MNDEELSRYSRHLLLPEFDYAGQEKLINSTVLLVGAGGLGSLVGMYLAAAGVGTLLLNDFDRVDLGNLQRQIAHRTADIGRPKVDSAADTLRNLNPHVRVETYGRKLGEEELEQLARRADLLIDASDNFATRHSLNRSSVKTQKPLVSGAAIRFEGQLAVYDPRNPFSPCYRCLYDDSVETAATCSQSGVFAPVVGMIASAQTGEAIKLLTGIGKPLIGRLWRIDGKDLSQRTSQLHRDPKCPVCSPSERARKNA